MSYVRIVGLAIGALGFAIFSYGISISAPYIVLLIPLMAVGFGTAFTMPAVTIAALEAVPETRSGVAAGFLNAFRQVGSLVGVAVFGTLIGRLSNIAAAMQLAAMVAAFLFGAGAIMSGFIKIKETLHWNHTREPVTNDQIYPIAASDVFVDGEPRQTPFARVG